MTVGQLPKIFGIEKGDGDTIRRFAHLIANLGSTSVVTLAVGAVGLAGLFGRERFAPRIPGGIVVLVRVPTLSSPRRRQPRPSIAIVTWTRVRRRGRPGGSTAVRTGSASCDLRDATAPPSGFDQ